LLFLYQQTNTGTTSTAPFLTPLIIGQTNATFSVKITNGADDKESVLNVCLQASTFQTETLVNSCFSSTASGGYFSDTSRLLQPAEYTTIEFTAQNKQPIQWIFFLQHHAHK
jgi:hypothetical protein